MRAYEKKVHQITFSGIDFNQFVPSINQWLVFAAQKLKNNLFLFDFSAEFSKFA